MRETFPVAKSEEKRMFSQAKIFYPLESLVCHYHRLQSFHFNNISFQGANFRFQLRKWMNSFSLIDSIPSLANCCVSGGMILVFEFHLPDS